MMHAGTVNVFCRFVILAALISAGVGAGEAQADRGSIMPVGDVDVSEPAQRAIIAHNGVREMIILQTDVQASAETKIVEFMPLPSRPEVSLAPEGCFESLAGLVEEHGLRYYASTGRRVRGEAASEEAIRLVFAAQLGPHAVTVVEVADVDAFMEWVREFFRTNRLGRPDFRADLRSVVADYLDRGLRFFAFDVIEISPERKTVQPLTYVFKHPRLYYPLKVTNLYGGTGVVEILTLVPEGVYAFFGTIAVRHGEGVEPVRVLHSRQASIAARDTEDLHPALPDMLGGERVILQAHKYEGPLSFDGDINEPVGYRQWDGGATAMRTFLKALERGDTERIEFVVDVPFLFDGRVITDRQELLAALADLMQNTNGRDLASGAQYFGCPRPTREEPYAARVRRLCREGGFFQPFEQQHLRHMHYEYHACEADMRLLAIIRHSYTEHHSQVVALEIVE